MPHRGNAFTCSPPFNFLSHYGNDKSTICQPLYPPFFSGINLLFLFKRYIPPKQN